MLGLKGGGRYQRSHSAHYRGFKLATNTFVLSILEFIFIATSHKHCTFTTFYSKYGFLLFCKGSYCKQLLENASRCPCSWFTSMGCKFYSISSCSWKILDTVCLRIPRKFTNVFFPLEMWYMANWQSWLHFKVSKTQK